VTIPRWWTPPPSPPKDRATSTEEPDLGVCSGIPAQTLVKVRLVGAQPRTEGIGSHLEASTDRHHPPRTGAPPNHRSKNHQKPAPGKTTTSAGRQPPSTRKGQGQLPVKAVVLILRWWAHHHHPPRTGCPPQRIRFGGWQRNPRKTVAKRRLVGAQQSTEGTWEHDGPTACSSRSQDDAPADTAAPLPSLPSPRMLLLSLQGRARLGTSEPV
jgi:hypothetical protein